MAISRETINDRAMKEEQIWGDPQRSHSSQLLPEEIRSPFDVLHAVLDSYSVRQLHDGLWELLYYAMASSAADGLPSQRRTKFLDLYKTLLRLTEAGALIDQYKLH